MLYVQNNIYKMDSFELNKIIAASLMVALLSNWYWQTIKVYISCRKT